MTGPYGGQDQAPGEEPMAHPEPAAPPPPEPTPAAPPPAPAPAAEPTAAAPAGQSAGWQTPAQTSTFGVPIAAGPAAGVAYADLVPRIIAYVIDAIILGIGFGILWSVVIGTLFVAGGFGGLFIGATVAVVFLLIASAIYFVYTWTHWRASPGQRILGLETVGAADGATISRDVAIRRWLFLYGPQAISWGATFALGALGSLIGLLVFGYYIYLLYSASQDPRRQGFHDKQVGTVVVKRGAA